MKTTIFVIIILLYFSTAKSQSVAINTDGSTAATSSILDIKSTTKGMLVPRMTNVEKNAIATPARGLLIYQNAPDSIGFHYYNGTIWVWLQPSTTGWDISGNNNILPTNFLGTINNAALKFRVFNQAAGIVDSTQKNTSLGYQTLLSNTTGFNNTAVGFDAGRSLTNGYGNAILGHKALAKTFNGSENVAIGDSAMGNAVNSSSNTAVGYHALKNLDGQVSQSINTAIGYSSQSAQTGTTSGFDSYFNTSLGGFALQNNVTGNSNVALGFQAMRYADSSSGNVAVGRSALKEHKRTDFAQNVAIGTYALLTDTTGNWNTAIGGDAMRNSAQSSLNSAIGFRALGNLKVGGENSVIGVGAMEYKDTALACIALGRFALAGHASNNNLPDTGSIGIGRWAGRYNNASENTFMGYYTASANAITGKENIGIGSYALMSLITGANNVAIGNRAHYDKTSGSFNVAIGAQAAENESFFAAGNVGIGYRAAKNNSGGNTVLIGRDAGFNNLQNFTVAIGDSALYNNGLGALASFHGTSNVAIGSRALAKNTLGYANTSLGYKALYNNTTGFNNAAIGNGAGYNLTTGNNNIIIGDSAASKITQTSFNVAIGVNALKTNNYNGIANNVAVGSNALFSDVLSTGNTALGTNALYYHKIGSQNVALGLNAALFDTSGSSNTAIGATAMQANSKGSFNTALGNNALTHNIKGSFNTGLGVQTRIGSVGLDSLNRATAVGFNATAMKNDALVLGDTTNVFVGIGTGYPEQKLHVKAANSFKNAGYFTSSSNTSYSVDGATIYATNTYAGNTDVAAVKGEVITTNRGYGVGGYFQGGYVGLWANVDNTNPGSGTRNTWGTYSSNIQSTTGINYGVQGYAQNGATNYGIYGSATGGTSYGVYCSGNGGYTGTWGLISDQKFKQNLEPLQSILPLINKVKTYSYFTKNKEYPYMNFSNLKQFGFVAQDLEKYFPNLVEDGTHPGANKDDPEIKFKSVNYIGMIPVLTAGMQEQQKEIEELKAKNKKLENDIKLIKEKLGIE